MSDTILFANHTNEDVQVRIGPNVKPPQTVNGIWGGYVRAWTTSGFTVSGSSLYAVGCVTQETVTIVGSGPGQAEACEFVVYDVTPGNAVTIAFKVSDPPPNHE